MMLPKLDFITAIKFVSHAAAKDDTRHYLNGVHFKFTGEQLVLSASDGHRLAHIKLGESDPTATDGDGGEYIVNNESIKKLLAVFTVKKVSDKSQLEISKGMDGIVVEGEGQSLTLMPIRGTYPDVNRILYQSEDPEGCTGIRLNPTYLKEASHALSLVTAGIREPYTKLDLWDINTLMRMVAVPNQHRFTTMNAPAYVVVAPRKPTIYDKD